MEFKDNNHIIQLWNEYCEEKGYHDDEIYTFEGKDEFVKQWWSCDGATVPADVVWDIVDQVKDYNGEPYYYWSGGNAYWCDNLNDGGNSPIIWSDFNEWCDENYPEGDE